MAYGKADKVIKEIFESLLSRYQIGLETSTRRSNSVQLLLCKYHKNFLNTVDHI